MKKIMDILSACCVVIALLILAGCKTFNSIPALDLAKEAIGIVTNLPGTATEAPDLPSGTPEASPGPSEATQAPSPAVSGLIAQGYFARPVIASGSDGTLAVAAEGPDMGSIYLYVKRPGKAWAGGRIIWSQKGGAYDAGRFYVPDIEISGNYVIVSCRAGNKEWGSMRGPCLYVLDGKGAGKFGFPQLTEGAARLEQDSSKTVYLMSKEGAWAPVVLATATIGKRANYPAGKTGEKFDFSIEGKTWGTAMNGYSAMNSAMASSSKRWTWADVATYPKQRDDLCYVSACVFSNRLWASVATEGRAYVQSSSMDGNLRWPINKLPPIGEAAAEQRCPPKLVGTPAGLYIVWRQGRSIMAGKVESLLSGGKGIKAGEGEFPSAAWDRSSTRLMVVYCTGSGLQVVPVQVN